MSPRSGRSDNQSNGSDEEETYSSDEEVSTPRASGHMQFNDRNMDLCLMEVKKIADNEVLSGSDNIKKILNSKLVGSLQYRITDCLERNLSLREIHTEYESLYGELKHLLGLARANLEFYKYKVGNDEKYKVASDVLQQAQKKFDAVRAQPEDILEDLVENEKSTLITVIRDFKKWYEPYIQRFGFTTEGQTELMAERKVAWRFRYIYHINDILNETFVDDLTSIDKYVSIYYLLRCIDSVNIKLTKGEYQYPEGIPELMHRLRDALGRVAYNTSMRKLYVQNREAAVVKEAESSMERQLKDLMQKVAVLEGIQAQAAAEKVTVPEDPQTDEKDSNTEDIATAGEAPPSRKPGFFKNIVRRVRGKTSETNGETNRLLMELESLGMSIDPV